jgi:type II secretory pathway component PulF
MANQQSPFLFDLSVKFEFGADKRYKFYMKLCQLLENGVPLDTALGQIEAIAGRTRSSVLPALYRRWRNNIANGMNFGQCLAPFIPSSEAMLIETGANSGKLITSLQNAAQSIEQQGKVKKAIITASAYPMVLVAMLIAALLLSSYKVIPTFEEIIPIEDWQGVSYAVAVTAQFIREYAFMVFVVVICLVSLIFYSLPRWTSKRRVFFDNFVPWSLYRMWQGSSFLLAISSMMGAGVKLDDVSLGRISKQADPYLKQRIRSLTRFITAGENLGDALYKSGYNFPDEEIIGDLQIYAKLRGFDHNLIWITRSWVDSLVERVTMTMKVVNTVVLMLIAVVIGCLIMSFYDVFQQIQTTG